MKSIWILCAASLALTACGQSVNSSENNDAMVDEADGQTGLQMAGPVDSEVERASDSHENEEGDEASITALDRLADTVCRAGDDGFSSLLAESQGFASRGGDARVHLAWSLNGEVVDAVVHTPSLNQDVRMPFDSAVADFLRHNLIAGNDWSEQTGAFRSRDGRFCVVQTEPDVIAALRDAYAAINQD